MFSISDATVAGLEAKAGMPPVGGSTVGDDPETPGPAAPHPEAPSPPYLVAAGDEALRRGAARGLVIVAAGLVVGGLIGGPLGAAAGVVGAGAARNTLRAKEGWGDPDPEVRAEAGKSATMAIFGLGIAGMLIYQAWKDDGD